MNGPEKKITRCVQNAGTVEVYGSFAAEGPERERLLFAKAGTLKTFSSGEVEILAPDGETEHWSAEESVRRDPVSLDEMFEQAFSGDRRITVRVLLFILFLAVALLFGAFDDVDFSGANEDIHLTE